MVATIQSARSCVTHQGTEQWAIKTICDMSELDVHPTEVTILSPVVERGSRVMRWVLSGGTILGSYSLEEVDS